MFDAKNFVEMLQSKEKDELIAMIARSDQYTPEAIELVNSEIKRRKLNVDCVVEQASKIKTEDAHLKTKEEKESSDTFWYLLDGAILVALGKSFGVVSALIIGTPAIFAVQTLKVIVGKGSEAQAKPPHEGGFVLGVCYSCTRCAIYG